MTAALHFELPRDLEAAAPPTVRDEVRLMVAQQGRPLVHTRFLDLADHLDPGDLLVVNDSATLPAALPALRADGGAVDLHLSTPDPSNPSRWVVEVRSDGHRARARAETLQLPHGGKARLIAPYLSPNRLWIAQLDLPEPLLDYLDHHGAPIRYAHEPTARPLEDHQTIFATHPGSAEMPSAGRPFTKRALTRLRERGIGVQRITLHTGVSSQERGERPYPERFAVSRHTAERVNAAQRVIAVGTTVVRALETVAQPDGAVNAGDGWTNLVVTPERGLWTVDGLLTGLHESASSHLAMLRAAAGDDLVARSYREALGQGYRWHEFGDSHLILGPPPTS